MDSKFRSFLRELRELCDRYSEPDDAAIAADLSDLAKNPMLNAIAEAVGAKLSVHPDLIMQKNGRCRSDRVAWARHLAMTLAFEFTYFTQTAVANAFRLSDHTSLIHAVERVLDETSYDKPKAILYNSLRSEIAQLLEAKPTARFRQFVADREKPGAALPYRVRRHLTTMTTTR